MDIVFRRSISIFIESYRFFFNFPIATCFTSVLLSSQSFPEENSVINDSFLLGG